MKLLRISAHHRSILLALFSVSCLFTFAIVHSAHAKPKKNNPAKLKPATTASVVKPTPLPTPVTSPSPVSSTPVAVGITGADFDLSKGPTNISSDTLTLFSEKRIFTYQGNVIVTQGDLTLTGDFLDGNYSEDNQIEKITARSNVTIVKGVDIKAGGQRAVYDANLRTIILTESPHVEQKGSILTADIITIYVDENRSVAEGNVKVSLQNTGDLDSSTLKGQ